MVAQPPQNIVPQFQQESINSLLFYRSNCSSAILSHSVRRIAVICYIVVPLLFNPALTFPLLLRPLWIFGSIITHALTKNTAVILYGDVSICWDEGLTLAILLLTLVFVPHFVATRYIRSTMIDLGRFRTWRRCRVRYHLVFFCLMLCAARGIFMSIMFRLRKWLVPPPTDEPGLFLPTTTWPSTELGIWAMSLIILVMSSLFLSFAAVSSYLPVFLAGRSLARSSHMPRKRRRPLDWAMARDWIAGIVALPASIPQQDLQWKTEGYGYRDSDLIPVLVAVFMHGLAGAAVGRFAVSFLFTWSLGDSTATFAMVSGASAALVSLRMLFLSGREVETSSIPDLKEALLTGNDRSIVFWRNLWRKTASQTISNVAATVPFFLAIYLVAEAVQMLTTEDHGTTSIYGRIVYMTLPALRRGISSATAFLVVSLQTVIVHYAFRIEAAQPINLRTVASEIYGCGKDPSMLANALLQQYFLGLPEFEDTLLPNPINEENEVRILDKISEMMVLHPLLGNDTTFVGGASRRLLIASKAKEKISGKAAPAHVRTLACITSAMGKAMMDAAFQGENEVFVPLTVLSLAHLSLSRAADIVLDDIMDSGRLGTCALLVSVVVRAAYQLFLGAACVAHGGDARMVLRDLECNRKWTIMAPEMAEILREAENVVAKLLLAAAKCGADVGSRRRYRDNWEASASSYGEEWIDQVWKDAKQK